MNNKGVLTIPALLALALMILPTACGEETFPPPDDSESATDREDRPTPSEEEFGIPKDPSDDLPDGVKEGQ